METPFNKRKHDNKMNFTSSTPIRTRKDNYSGFPRGFNSQGSLAQNNNAMEISFTPSKKSKQVMDDDENCFSNAAFDLQVADRKVNPFEVVRPCIATEKVGLFNPALDIGIEESEEIPKNPPVMNKTFEIPRDENEVNIFKGIDNPGLELNNSAGPLSTMTAPLVMALPFQPTVNHRIDFSNIPSYVISQMLHTTHNEPDENEKQFQIICQQKNETQLKEDPLYVIQEEDGDLDIGQKLDEFQLELENSINEAKIKKTEKNEEAEKLAENYMPSTKNEQCEMNNELNNVEENEENDENQHPNKDDDDVQFEEVDSFEDYGNFRRAYRTRDNSMPKSAKKPAIMNLNKNNFGSVMRRSVRKLINRKSTIPKKETTHDAKENHAGLFQTIRQSLRKRRTNPKLMTIVSPNRTILERPVFREVSKIEPQNLPKKPHDHFYSCGKREITVENVMKFEVKMKKTFKENVEIFENL